MENLLISFLFVATGQPACGRIPAAGDALLPDANSRVCRYVTTQLYYLRNTINNYMTAWSRDIYCFRPGYTGGGDQCVQPFSK